MGNKTVFKEFLNYVSLNLFGQMAFSCYTLADTFFVSADLGADGITALNLAFPVFCLVNGTGLMIGMGGGTRYSILRSRGENQRADQVFSAAIDMAVCFAAVFVLSGLFFSNAIARMLGADDTVFSMTDTYLKVMLLFAPAFLLNHLLQCFVRNDGSPSLSMAAMTIGSFANVALDYLFIFPLHMGIFGAILATGLAPVISILVLSSYLLRGKNKFHLLRSGPGGSLESVFIAGKCRIGGGFSRWSRQIFAEMLDVSQGNLTQGSGKRPVKTAFHGCEYRFLEILSSGVPSFVTELTSGIVMFLFNFIILRLAGNTGVAAFAVITVISLVVVAIYTGLSQGIQPLIGLNHGAGNLLNVKVILKYAVIAVLLLSGIVYAILFFYSSRIVSVFNSEGNEILQTLAETGLKLYFLACPFIGFNIVMATYFTSTERPFPAQVISLLRGFFILIPMAFLLSAMLGMTGVWCAYPLTECIVFLIGTAFATGCFPF